MYRNKKLLSGRENQICSLAYNTVTCCHIIFVLIKKKRSYHVDLDTKGFQDGNGM